MDNVCIITARKGSKGLENKNVTELNGKPLLLWPILTALESNIFKKVILNSDSTDYLELAKNTGADLYLRPPDLGLDNANSIDVILENLENYESKGVVFKNVCLLEPTSPLTEPEDLITAYKKIDLENFNSVVGVGEVGSANPNFTVSIDNKNRILLNNAKNIRHVRRQDVSDYYFFDGSLYFSKVSSLKANKSFYTSNTYAMVFNKVKNLEIDDAYDFKIIEAILRLDEKIY